MLTNFFKLIKSVGGVPVGANGKQWEARCPAHDDNRASLAIGMGDDGKALVCCHAGCELDDILAAVGMTKSDLYPEQRGRKSTGTIVAAYDYHDADGTLLFQVVRFDPKDFRQRQPDGDGWKWSVKGIKQVPYRLPELVAADAATPIFICEGEKDADRLASLGLVATCNAGGAAKASPKNPRPLCKWKKTHSQYFAGRTAVILPDNDEPGRDHANGVAASLHGTAVTSIKIINLPGLTDKGDLSDWLDGGGSADELLKLAADAGEWESPAVDAADNESNSEKPGFVKILSDLICESDRFARDIGGKLFRYRGGAYRARGEDFIRKRVKALCIQLEATKDWSKRLAEEVVEFIRVDAAELWERPPADVVNVTNGILQLNDRVLLPHSPDHLSTIQLPVQYDPSATCPTINQFITDTFPADAIELAYEIPAVAITPNTSIQKAVLLIGGGGNGKSIFLGLVIALIGKQNTSALALHRIETDRFSGSRLIGKLANVCADLPSEHLAGTSMFKLLTGGDPIEAERKFCDSFEFTPFARLIFSANSLPRSQDASEGFFDRWLVIPFDARFRGTDREVSRQELDAKLLQPSELSGFLNKVIEAWQRIHKTGRLSEPASIREAWREFHAMTDPLAVWLDRYTIDDPQAAVPSAALRTAYGAACERSGRPPLSDKAFTRQLLKHRTAVEVKQRTVNSRVQRCYIGIGLASEQNDYFTTSRDSRDTPTSIYRRREDELGDREVVEERINKVGPCRESREVVKCKHEWELRPDRYNRPGWTEKVCKLCEHSEGYCQPLNGAA